MHGDSKEDKERNLLRGRKLLKYTLCIVDAVFFLVGGILYYRAWQKGEDPISLIASASVVFGGLVLVSLWAYWIGVKVGKQFHE